jgi:hypothetical protein
MPLVADAKKYQAARSASLQQFSLPLFIHNPAVHSQRLGVQYPRSQIYADPTRPAPVGSPPNRACAGRTPCIA